MNFYLPMPAADSAPPPPVQQANPYEGYTAIGGDAQDASGPINGYLPQAMPALMQIEGPVQDTTIQFKRNSAPRASRNAPPAAFPGSLPPAGNQQVCCLQFCLLERHLTGPRPTLTYNTTTASEITRPTIQSAATALGCLPGDGAISGISHDAPHSTNSTISPQVS